MKKGIYIIMMAVIICQGCFSKECGEQNGSNNQYTVEQLFKTFSKEKNVNRVSLDGFLMSLARLFSDTKGVSGIEVYDFDECDKSVISNFNSAIENLKDSSYETLISTKEDGERTKVLVKIKDDYITELVVIEGGHDPTLVRIKGKIRPDDMNSVIEKNK